MSTAAEAVNHTHKSDLSDWDSLVNRTRTEELLRRSDTYNVGVTRTPLDTAMWQSICRKLYARVVALEETVARHLVSAEVEVATVQEQAAEASVSIEPEAEFIPFQHLEVEVQTVEPAAPVDPKQPVEIHATVKRGRGRPKRPLL